LNHSELILKISKIFSRLKLTDDRIAAFAVSQLQDREQILRVYHSWVYFRKLKMNARTFIEITHANSINVKMIFGTNDRIVRQKTFEHLIQRAHAAVLELHATHSRLSEQLNSDNVISFLISNME